MSALVESTIEKGVAEVVLNDPTTRNAITGPLGEQLEDALVTANKDPAVSCVLLRGAGGAFCSGLNLKQFNADPPPKWMPHFGAIWRSVHVALYENQKPLIVALERFAINGGAALALAADLLVVGADSFLQVGEVRQGMNAPYNTAWIKLRYPEHIATQLLLLGHQFSGERLLSMGIAYAAPATSETLKTARDLASEVASFPPEAASRLKSSLQRMRGFDGNEWFDHITQQIPASNVKPSRVS